MKIKIPYRKSYSLGTDTVLGTVNSQHLYSLLKDLV